MQHLSRLLYTRLLCEFCACQQKSLSWDQVAVCGFRVAERYWRLLQVRVCRYQFATSQEEIDFFKKDKPRFTAEITFHTFCYCAFLFQPAQPAAAINFWCREEHRLQRFIEDNPEFYAYYKEGRTEKDKEYFLRKNFDPRNILEAKVYDADACALTNKDPFVASILALEKYTLFAAGKRQCLYNDP